MPALRPTQDGSAILKRPVFPAAAPPLVMATKIGTLIGTKASGLGPDCCEIKASNWMASNVNDQLLAILRCPEDHSRLSPADAGLVLRLNAAIRAGRLRNQSGQSVDRA